MGFKCSLLVASGAQFQIDFPHLVCAKACYCPLQIDYPGPLFFLNMLKPDRDVPWPDVITQQLRPFQFRGSDFFGGILRIKLVPFRLRSVSGTSAWQGTLRSWGPSALGFRHASGKRLTKTKTERDRLEFAAPCTFPL